MAIGMRFKRYEDGLTPLTSKFFGSPAMPREWGDDFYDDTMFLCQINLEELAPFDTEGVFPHEGFLYIFLDTEGGEYGLLPIVRYARTPSAVFLDFNKEVPGYEKYITDVGIEFFITDDYEEGTRLLGYPADWPYGDEPPRLLLQIDHYDYALDFLSHIDGFTYITLGEDLESFSDVTILQEYS